ncbi:MAG TPA: GAF domain-containing protein [Planctomycetes bacterium]|nr:GAF domain-containing protein [Planctomycetota bacterium]
MGFVVHAWSFALPPKERNPLPRFFFTIGGPPLESDMTETKQVPLDHYCKPYLVHVFRNGERTTHRFRKAGITLGRSRKREIPLPDKSISRHHLSLRREGQKFMARDEGSQNGTLIDGKKLPPNQWVEIPNRGTLKIGPFQIQVEAVHESLDEHSLATEDTKHSGGPLDTGTFARLIQALNEELDPERLLELIVESAIRATEAERGFLVLRKGDNLSVPVAKNFVGEDIQGGGEKISKTIVQEVLGSGDGRLTVNAQSDERFKDLQSVEDLRLRSVLCVPLRVLSEIVGVLYLDNRLQQHAFSDEDRHLLQVLADISGVAIRNSRLVSDLRKKNEELLRAHEEVAALNARLAGRVKKQTAEIEEMREELDASRKIFGLRHSYKMIIGESPAMQDVFRLLDRYVDATDPVLILGESGTGKELVARVLHEQGPRAEGPFVSENCAALPESLLESELFGYSKGAFTGATRDHDGLFVQAKGGTLFLDEVGDMSPDLQSKLLRVIQEKEVRPLGSAKTIPIDIRLVTATHRDLRQMVQEGAFREDLFYRLHVLPIQLPPLRKRKGDIPLLVSHLLKRCALEAKVPAPRINPKALDILSSYHWPGNVRELENELRRALLLTEGEILPEHLSDRVRNPGLEDLENSPLPSESGTTLPQLVQRLEENEIRRALTKAGGNKSKAAAFLGISRFALQRKLEKYEI